MRPSPSARLSNGGSPFTPPKDASLAPQRADDHLSKTIGARCYRETVADTRIISDRCSPDRDSRLSRLDHTRARAPLRRKFGFTLIFRRGRVVVYTRQDSRRVGKIG